MNARSRTWFVVLLALAVAGIVVVVSRLRVDRAPSRAAEAASTTVEPPKPHVESTTLAAPAANERSATVAVEARASREQAPPAGSFRLHGTLALTGVDGSVSTTPNAELSLSLAYDSTGAEGPLEFLDGRREERALTVTAGRWETTFDASSVPSHVSVSRVSSDGADALVSVPHDVIAMPKDGFVEVRARFRRPTTLRVLAAESRTDLSAIVLVASPPSHDREEHPGAAFESLVRARDLTSPIDLTSLLTRPRPSGKQRWFVGVDGRAWGSIDIDFDLGGEFLIELAHGGDLEIAVTHQDPASFAVLRLRRPGRPVPSLTTSMKKDAVIRLSGLAPGPLEIRAEIGDWFDDPIVLASAQVEIVAGSRAFASLELARAPAVEIADIAGTLLVPAEWDDERPSAMLAFIGTPLGGIDGQRWIAPSATESPRAGVRAFRWHVERVQVGRHEFSVTNPPFTTAIEVPAGGRADYVIEIPPPCELRVRLVEAGSGKDVEVSALHWNPKRPEGVDGGSLESGRLDASTGCYLLRAPCAPIDLQIFDLRYLPVNSSADPTSVVGELRIELAPACGAIFTLRDGDVTVSWPDDWYGQPSAAEGTTGRTTLSTRDGTTHRFQFSAPGTYVLRPPKIAGYREPPPQPVVARDHEFVEHVIQLERETR